MTGNAVSKAKVANWLWRAYHERPTTLAAEHELSRYQQQLLATIANDWGDKAWHSPKAASNYSFLTTANFEWPEPQAELVNVAMAQELESGLQLVMVNGKFCPELSKLTALPAGVIVDSLAAAIINYPQLVMPYLITKKIAQQPLLALNTLLANDGLFIYLPAASKVLQPLQVITIVNSAKPQPLIQSHNLLILGEQAQLSCSTEYFAVNNTDNYLNNVVVDVVLEAAAVLNYYNFANTATKARHCVTTFIEQQQDSVTNIYNASFGGQLSVNNFNVMLKAAAAQCQLKGFYGLHNRGQQHAHTIRVDHAAINTQSIIKFNGVIANDAHAIFDAKVLVHRDAAQARATQQNHNLLLNKLAAITSKPELEIYAEDVNCRHGATIGQLDAEALFYLQTRGIAEAEARLLLLQAFMASTMDALDSPYLKLKIQQCWATSIARLL